MREFIDIDEATFALGRSYRRRGHGKKGERAAMAHMPPKTGDRYNCLIAVDTTGGVIAKLCFVGSTTTAVFYAFLCFMVIPAIAGTGQRTLMWDNLSAHFHVDIDALLAAHGHRSLARPTHSPDFGPVEWAFNHADQFLRHHMMMLDENNFEAAMHAAFDSIAGADVARYFQAAHYAVPTLPFRPYVGQQVI